MYRQTKTPFPCGVPQKEGCQTHGLDFPLIQQGTSRLLSIGTQLAVLSEALNGTDHLRGAGVLVVVPGHDLNLIGVVVATLNFHDFFVIVHNFETTVTVPQHTVVVPKPACSYHDCITF